MKIGSVLYMPDGNRRYARIKHVSLKNAYYKGGKVLETLAKFFLDGGLANTLIFYGVSAYTGKRADKTPAVIHQVILELFREWADTGFFSKKGINVHIVNHSQKLSADLKKAGARLMRKNQEGREKEIFILLGYSEAADVNAVLSAKPQNYQEYRQGLLFPDIDLVIRTLEMRLSGGPVYAMSQSQMMILDRYNPQVGIKDLNQLWQEYCRLVEYRVSTNAYHSRVPLEQQ